MKHQVENWMTKHPLRVDVNESAESASGLMKVEMIRHLLVTDEGRLVGILSAVDLALMDKIKAKFRGVDFSHLTLTVGDLMGRNPVTISAKASMAEAIRLMNDRRIHSLPVSDEYGRLRGILTSTDVMRYALVASQHLNYHGPGVSIGV